VNLPKSRFLPSSSLTKLKYVSIVEFHHTYKHGKYLGFTLLSAQIKKHDFACILDRVNDHHFCGSSFYAEYVAVTKQVFVVRLTEV
jgi:hypothetical protein